MSSVDSRGSQLDIDLESGGASSDEDENIYRTNDHSRRSYWSQNEYGGTDGVHLLGSYNGGAFSSASTSIENFAFSSDQLDSKMHNFLEKEIAKENRRKPKSKKHPKPPRPSRGPSLGSADMRLVKEISDLSMSKHQRAERMKALKRMKSEKAYSFNSSVCAMVVTVVFFFIIILQGLLGSRV